MGWNRVLERGIGAVQAGVMTGTLPSARRIATIAVPAIALPVLVTMVASWLDLGPFGPPSLYLLAVVAAAIIGGATSGIAAAACSFVGLNYYFTEPVHTLRVGKAADVVALVVFLVVAVVVGALVARALADRERAERQEEELRLVNRAATKLLSDEPSSLTISQITDAVTEQLALERCSVEVGDAGSPIEEEGDPFAGGAGSIVVPITARDVTLGALRASRRIDEPFTVADHRLLQALAGLLGLALERSRLDSEARSARTEAEISDARAALFSSVTHDVRTPLASIKAGVSSLMDASAEFEPDERAELFITVMEETDRLSRLLDNLLNLARARAGGVAIDREFMPIEDVVETVLARSKAALEPFDLRTRVDDGLPGVWVDPIQMDQALTNVIENAARYSPRGTEIVVAVARVRDGIQIRVADHGPGISPDERDQVFEPFFRGSAGTGLPGTGLGLPITRAVVLAHGGSLALEGSPGGGLAVVIELPIADPEPPRPRQTERLEPGVGG
jgi:two-component system sensor histidine kinase KdpD